MVERDARFQHGADAAPLQAPVVALNPCLDQEDGRVRVTSISAGAALLLFAMLPSTLRAQSNRGTDIPLANTPVNVGPKIAGDTSDYLYGVDPDFRHRMLTARRDEQKKRMIENASKLLEMSRQLDVDLEGREPTPADVKRLDEISKLARAVRDQMRQ